MNRLTFEDTAGMHFTQAMCQDVLDFMRAAAALSDAGPRGRNLMLFNTASKLGKPEVTTVGGEFDAALAKLGAHFGLTISRSDAPKKRGRGKRSGGA